LEPRVAEELETKLGVPLIEGYASSETGHALGNPRPPGHRKHGTVGVPLQSKVSIRSSDGAFLSSGEKGEMIVKGPEVFEGYENNPEVNAESFVDGWFRTGDEGFFDSDGYLTLTGRIKEMINRGGEKVSPAEVDKALMGHSGVIEAACFPIPHPTLGEEVAAAVVREAGSEVTEKELTRFLLGKLARFKVPRRFVFVDEIPKSDAGKVQRYKLAEALGVTEFKSAAPMYRPDRDPTPFEFRLHSIWKRVLGIKHLGLDENFFLLGGDSLKAVELFFEIERELGQRLPMAVLFEAGTVAEMAKIIEEGEPQGCMVAIQPAGLRPPFFCVHGAKGEVIAFRHLAKYLGDDQPFYGIQAVGWDAATPPFTQSTDMAAHYVAEMRTVQPHGPYYLGGFSFGGRIAVYMANMLKQAGEEVALLVLLDPSSLVGRHSVTFRQWLERAEAPLGLARIPLAFRYAFYRAKTAYNNAYDRARRAVLFPIREHYRATGKPVPISMRRPDRLNLLIRFEHQHMPIYNGDAVQFRTAMRPNSMSHADVKDSWDRVIKGRLEVVPVPGRHVDILREPSVQDLAKGLSAALDKAFATAKRSEPR
jgi:thioesterase domain-containing protein/acyl carrier protein